VFQFFDYHFYSVCLRAKSRKKKGCLTSLSQGDRDDRRLLGLVGNLHRHVVCCSDLHWLKRQQTSYTAGNLISGHLKQQLYQKQTSQPADISKNRHLKKQESQTTDISNSRHLKRQTSQTAGISNGRHLKQRKSQQADISNSRHLKQQSSQKAEISNGRHLKLQAFRTACI